MSLLDAQVAWLANRAGDWLIGGIEPQRLGNAHPSIVPYETFEAADGYINLAIGNDEQFARFCREAGRDDLADDPRYRPTATGWSSAKRWWPSYRPRSRPGRWPSGWRCWIVRPPPAARC